MTPPPDKGALRRALLAARRAVPAEVRAAEAAGVAARVRALRPTGPVCAHVPVGSEPGGVLDGLAGARVLLPVVVGGGALDWAEHTGELRRGPHGLLEPTGPRLGPDAPAAAVLVLVPALAVDRRGVRLGRGGGYYDRALRAAAPGTPLVAVVRDAELVDALPAEPHDVPVTAVLTPSRGPLALPLDGVCAPDRG